MPASAEQVVHYPCNDEATDGDKYQRVRKLTMVFQIEQRVGAGADQAVEVGCHARHRAEQGGGSDVGFFTDSLWYARAEHALGNGIH